MRDRLERLLSTATLALAVVAILAAPALAATQFLGDGAIQNATGTWDLPPQGSCVAAAGLNPPLTTRAECGALRFNTPKASCTGNYSFSNSACNDLVHTDATSCSNTPGRLWNPATSICAVTMKGEDRNNVECTLLGGTWQTLTDPAGFCSGTWVIPDASTYNPPLLNRTGANPGSGDQCLRCHNSKAEYNSVRVRDVETFLQTGHRNMSRKVVAPLPWAGPGGHEYPTDDGGNAFDWDTGRISVGGTSYDLAWIYADWLDPLPRSIYLGAAPVNGKPAMSYSCARCHTTGWTSDAAIPTFTGGELMKEPEKTWNGITWDGIATPGNRQVNLAGGVTGDSNKMASWDVWGIECSRCHGSAVENQNADGTKHALPMSAATNMSTHNAGWTTTTDPICSNPRYTSTGCAAAGGTVLPSVNPTAPAVAGCTLAGVCSISGVLHPEITSQAACTGTGSSWAAATDVVRCLDIAEYGKDNNVPAYAAAKYYGTQPQRGMVITGLCMQCHRQESGGQPIEQTDASNLRVGNVHGAVGFISHPGGNQYLNSPHGKYTGTFAGVPTTPFTYSPTGNGYRSYFIQDGEAANTGNGCTGCHNVHNSVVDGATATFGIKEECTECHAKTAETTQHPTGAGTPFANGTTGEGLFEACVTCHMPNGIHLFRINQDVNYATYPVTALTAGSTGVLANTAPSGTYTNAVWVDMDLACGQCHGGGNSHQTTTISAGGTGAVLTVASSAGFDVGARIRIAGAGAVQADGVTRGDFYGNVKSVDSPTQITLLGGATIAADGRTLEQNPTKNGAGWKSKATLAALAVAMHQDKPEVRFTLTTGSPTLPLKVNGDASASTCSGSAANCNAYSWSWGDNTANGSGVTASHTYAAPGTYTVTLTVTQYSTGPASASKDITVNGPGPTAAGTCTFDPNTWKATVTDSSTAGTSGSPLRSVAVFWGDGTAISIDKTPADGFGPFAHTYLISRAAPGFVVKEKATDSRGRQSTVTLACTPAAAPAYFTITGTVQDSGGVALSVAKVQLYLGTKLVRSAYTDVTGNVSIGFMKPGTYTVVVTKTGYTFANPTASIQVGPDGSFGTVKATAP